MQYDAIIDSLSDRVLQLSAALSVMAIWLALSLAGNIWQASAPSYSDSDRANLNAFVAQCTSHE